SRPNDEQRLASLVQAATGFEQIDLAVHFFDMFPRSKFRPALMLLFGDILEVTAVRLSREANSRLRQGEMAATAAPLHSYFLSYVGLDRYRKLGIKFLFNPSTRNYHYDGASWNAIVRDHANSPEVAEAQKRLQILKERMETVKK
ncbi:MAG: hypothetical protein H0V76_01145, partial [Blastocatellia bacterium]|nr:hypothetical protein [Blastocatellia bacterium]